ncbi:histidine kinase dimerization/phospho-acceptor domain-containing protein, partial [Kitasatospora sp. NPDC048296]|uniref:histidine kinase dimerization/phospho-acceptor domain-containing protein n=1 Tax=Kitasatospora sp. NPDC048296 TaxID=3364048 RepID=UPI00371556B9
MKAVLHRFRKAPRRTPAENRARRLRWRLTALYALTSTIGLVALAAFAVHNDDVSRRHQTDDALKLQATQTIAELAYDDNGQLDTRNLPDFVDTSCPPVTVLTGTGDSLRTVYTPRQPCVHVRDTDIRAAAQAAVLDDSMAKTDARTDNGHSLRLLAQVFTGPDDKSAGGVVMVAADTTTDQDAHRDLALLLTAGCAVALALSALAGHLLSGRAIRPTVTAVHQHETFLADAAHDLRTPAASLRLLAETALRDDAARTEALKRTVSLATRMGDLVDGLLTRARLTAGVTTLATEPLRLDQLVETVVDDTHTGENVITLRTEPTVVAADPDLLRRAVTNLLANALTHGHAPGQPAEIELTVTSDG